jgi:hypothetical protein
VTGELSVPSLSKHYHATDTDLLMPNAHMH